MNAPAAQCTCTRLTADTLAGTLDCPAAWWEQPGGTWLHVWPPRYRATTRHDRKKAA